MTAPHIRDLNPNGWHEVPKGATIPAGTRLIATRAGDSFETWVSSAAYGPGGRPAGDRYFTAEPIPDPREDEIEAEAKRLWGLAYPDGRWLGGDSLDCTGFRRLAADSLDRQAARE